MRGFAAVVMLQGHVFHSFTGKEWRDGSIFQLTQFVGGIPPAIFLFLTGITMAFLMDSSERKGFGLRQRWTLALRRAAYLFVLAYVFRFQLWLFGQPASPWTDLLKVDILNSMGVGLGIVSVMTVFSTVDRARLSAFLGVAIAAVSPLVSSMDWTGIPAPLKMYLAPDYNFFSLFPWVSFLCFGLSIGSVLRATRTEHHERLMEWLALAGFGFILAGQYTSNLPYSPYPRSEFWLDSPALVFIKLGLILSLMAFSFAWNRFVIVKRWNWLRQLGTTSLLVYWVHIELVYGRWFWSWKENLTVAQSAIAAATTIVLMLGLSVLQTNWGEIRLWFSTVILPAPAPQED
ncbi:MAG: DUF1624 domain-containing protein [Bryobacterales bacterium]|nr:DUF1624 domain-containing protein [Bryobacterales bacterium]